MEGAPNNQLNYPMLFVGFIFTLAACIVVAFLVKNTHHDETGCKTGETRPAWNTGTKLKEPSGNEQPTQDPRV